MKNVKYLILFIFSLTLITSCQEDDLTVGDLVTPGNIDISITYLDDTDDDGVYEEQSAPGLGSGLVRFSATADNATSFHFVIQGATKLQANGMVEHNFTVLGDNTYAVTVIAYGTGGLSASRTIEVDVLALYEPPEDLLQMLYGSGERRWKIAADVDRHFGLGPPGGSNPFEWYGAAAQEKANTGMYDDRYTFREDGTMEHDTGEDGWVFGREVLIEELNGPGGEPDGADIIQYPYDDYTVNWSITAPGGVETINLTDLGFFGYYVGGNHQYIIHSRSDNEMILKTLDGNGSGEFTWWFRLVPE